MSNSSVTVLWIYIALLLAGGVMGFVKAGSKVSLIASSLFAALLALCALRVANSLYLAIGVITVVLLVFVMRYSKSKKFMPAGLMVILSFAAGAALVILR